MTKHVMDHQPTRSTSRVRHFLRLARAPRETWHRPQAESGPGRIVHFLRILKGREV